MKHYSSFTRGGSNSSWRSIDSWRGNIRILTWSLDEIRGMHAWNNSTISRSISNYSSFKWKHALQDFKILSPVQNLKAQTIGYEANIFESPFPMMLHCMLFQGPNFFSFERTCVLLSYYFCRPKQKCGWYTKNTKSKKIEINIFPF